MEKIVEEEKEDLYENWDARTARSFACWCIRNTPLESGGTVWNLLTDDRSRDAVKIAEQFANGKATKAKLVAAMDAAEGAAWAIAGESITWAGEGDAAGAITWAAMEVAAWDATGATAKAIAWAAAWAAAKDAAMSTADDVAWDVAWDAAWDAAKVFQTKELLRLSKIERRNTKEDIK